MHGVKVSVKHLNPRQGITTSSVVITYRTTSLACETPKSPPGDYNVGELNEFAVLGVCARVKHLNPRQGITTLDQRQPVHATRSCAECETPKSPPGDYNRELEPRIQQSDHHV